MGTLVFDSLVVGGGGIGSFNLDENVNLMANEFMMQYGASIDGEPTISSDIQNFGGKIRPGTSEFFDPFDVGVPGSIVIEGDYAQVGIPAIGSLPRYGSMEFDIEPESFEIPHDTLTVTGHVTLGGILELNFETSYVDVGDSFDLISAQSVSGEFNLLWTRGLQNGEVARIEDQIGLSGNGDDITIGETNDIQFGAVGSVLLNSSGSPTDFLVVDLDGQGGLDAVVSRIGTSPQGTGVIEIYYDIYSGPSSTTSISVGRYPQGLVADDFDGDGDVDLAVVNTNDDSMSILTNNGTTFSAQTIQVVDEPVDLAVGDFVSSTPLLDLAVASSSANSIEIYENTSVLLVVGFQFKSAIFAGTPDKINPGDVSNDKDFDLIAISSGDDSTFDIPGYGDGGVTSLQVVGTPSATRVPVGIDPLEFAVGDMNGDGLDDTVIINGDESVSVRLDTSDVAATVTLGGFPTGISVGDLDNDGDNDVVITALDPYSFDREHGEQSVIIIRNDTVESSTITLTNLGSMSGSGTLIDLGDVNEDGLLDIIVVSESGGVAEQIEYWLNASPSSTCVGDFDGNGEVRVNDLLYLISAWGNQGGDADLDGNGIVAVADLLILISNWGPCT